MGRHAGSVALTIAKLCKTLFAPVCRWRRTQPNAPAQSLPDGLRKPFSVGKDCPSF
jgi:hypothetical protein